MTSYNARTTADEIVAGVDLTGKVAIVTGANTGIGFDTARALAAAGARVFFACRNKTTGQAAVARTQQQHPGCKAEFLKLDLASVESIEAFAEMLAVDHLDILVCNAGLITTSYEETDEGLEKTVGVCHYGHFLLTQRLLPRLLAATAPRVVMVSSESHRSPKTLNFDQFPLSKDTFGTMRAYGQAKLANVLMANELQRRYSAQGLTACSLHPGALVTTDIGRGSLAMRIIMQLISPFTKTPNQGASTSVYCAIEANASLVAGQYYSHCQPARMSAEAADEKVAAKLWQLSEDWVAGLAKISI